jgi:hypothetical protein
LKSKKHKLKYFETIKPKKFRKKPKSKNPSSTSMNNTNNSIFRSREFMVVECLLNEILKVLGWLVSIFRKIGLRRFCSFFSIEGLGVVSDLFGSFFFI